jgi:hypothetical protein
MTRFQRLEEQFDRIGDQFERFGDQMDALTEQFAAMGIANERRYQSPGFLATMARKRARGRRHACNYWRYV